MEQQNIQEELMEIFNDANRPVYVAVDENDSVMGYTFCIKKKQPFSTNMVPFDSLLLMICVWIKILEENM